MSITEILQLADKLTFSHTGKHLDDVQEAVVKGVWEGQTYAKIGEECHRSEARVRDVAYKLWRILSESLGEDINKANFCSAFERVINSQSNYQYKTQFFGLVNSSINFCPNYPPNNSDKPINNKGQPTTNKTPYHNLKQSPKITKIYGRTTEISTLSQWLENPNTRLISVLGITGIGKSTLVKHLIDTHTLPFDAIIWKNLKLSSSLDSILTEVLTELDPDTQIKNTHKLLNQALELFTKKRCLIILDNLQDIFTPQQLAGRYQPENQDYQTFFQMITEIEHQSCIILISQEKCQEMISLDTELYPSHYLELFGLDEFYPTDYLLKKGEFDMEEAWLRSINLYEGNPKFLQSVNTLIKDVFDGDVSEFIKEDCLILTEDIKSIFDSIWRRLADVEKNILFELSRQNQPMSRDDIKQLLSLSSPELINGLQSLTKRFLLTPLSGNQKLFGLSAVLRKYLNIFTTT
jgi:NB-ARC domain